MSPMLGDLSPLLGHCRGITAFIIDKGYIVCRVKIDKPLKHEYHQADLVIIAFLGYLPERLQREDLRMDILESSFSPRPFGLDDSDVLQNHRK